MRKQFLFKNPWLLGIAGVIVIGLLFMLGIHLRALSGQTGGNKTLNLVGQVEPADAVDLSFNVPGQVVEVTKIIGDPVMAGETIVEIDNSALRAKLSQAEATLQYQKAKLAELQSGTSTKQVALIEAQIANDQQSVNSGDNDLLSIFDQDASTSEDAIYNKVDEFFLNPRTTNPQLAFSVTVTPETSIQSGRVQVEKAIGDLNQLAATATTTADLTALSDSVESDLGEIKLFLDNTALAISALTPNGFLSQDTVTRWSDDMASAREEVDDSITATLAAEENFKSAESTLTLDQRQLDLEKTANVGDEIAAQKAEVSQAQADVDSVNAELAATRLVSPIAGIVTRQDARLGQNVAPNVDLVSIISNAKFEIVADVSENDIGKISVGDQATVTLGAYGANTTFKAVVVSIDQAESVADAPATYKTTFQFEDTDPRIRSGMTADVTVHDTGV